MKKPLVSVIMPTYNEKIEYVEDAVKSILNQTMQNLELLIIDDSTKTETIYAIDAFAKSDNRIRVIRCRQRLGLVEARNTGLRNAQGEYIACMDGDDIAAPERFEKQVRFLERHPSIGVCGSWAIIFGDCIGKMTFPTRSEMLNISLLFHHPFVNTSTMIRQSILDGMEYLNSKTEDYDLWVRLAMKGVKMANIPQYLVSYRLHADNTQNKVSNIPYLEKLYKIQLVRLNINPTEEEVKTNMIVTELANVKKEMLPLMANWLLKLRKANGRVHVYPKNAFIAYLLFRWILACMHTAQYGNLFLSFKIAGVRLFNPVVLGKLIFLMAEKIIYR
jgi:glycosyltransferase involved in cell wall biosynthesis